MTQIHWPTVDDMLAVPPGTSKTTDHGLIHGWYGDRRMDRTSPRKLVRVETRPNLSSVNGYMCKAGVNYMLVYTDEISNITKQLPTDEQRSIWKAATNSFKMILDRFKRESGVYEIRGEVERTQRAEKAEKEILNSPEQQYHQMVGMEGTGFPHVVSLDVCGDVMPMAQTAEVRANAAATDMATAFANAIKEGNKELLQTLAQVLNQGQGNKQKNA